MGSERLPGSGSSLARLLITGHLWCTCVLYWGERTKEDFPLSSCLHSSMQFHAGTQTKQLETASLGASATSKYHGARYSEYS